MSVVSMADNPQKPYGDVKYADPGYQADKKARYPIDTAEHVRAAWSYINQARNAELYSASQLADIKGRIRAAAKHLGVHIEDNSTPHREDNMQGRSQAPAFERTWDVEIEILSRAKGGDGRTVEAYAAVFDSPTEVSDGHGHYVETIDRAAFDRTLRSNGGAKAMVVYNHGLDLYGRPSGLGSVPIGKPVDIRADGKGLLTVSRYNKSELADAVLESIKNGDITAQSFRGRIFRSSPQRVPKTRPGDALPNVTRHELGLTDYGPTPVPVYGDASIMSVRSLLSNGLDPATAERLVELLSSTRNGPDDGSTDSDPDSGTDDSRLVTRSARLDIVRLRARATLEGVI